MTTKSSEAGRVKDFVLKGDALLGLRWRTTTARPRNTVRYRVVASCERQVPIWTVHAVFPDLPFVGIIRGKSLAFERITANTQSRAFRYFNTFWTALGEGRLPRELDVEINDGTR